MRFLTLEQHYEVLKNLHELARPYSDRIPSHSAGMEYTSVMVSFLLQNLSVAETLVRLLDSFSSLWFPITVGYSITRMMFETDINAHYITLAPSERARQYIEFGRILNKRKMDTCAKQCKNVQWREYMNLV